MWTRVDYVEVHMWSILGACIACVKHVRVWSIVHVCTMCTAVPFPLGPMWFPVAPELGIPSWGLGHPVAHPTLLQEEEEAAPEEDVGTRDSAARDPRCVQVEEQCLTPPSPSVPAPDSGTHPEAPGNRRRACRMWIPPWTRQVPPARSLRRRPFLGAGPWELQPLCCSGAQRSSGRILSTDG